MEHASPVLRALCQLAEVQRIGILDYRKPAEEVPTRRWVEPYQLQYSQDNLIALCWQTKPTPTDTPHAWRCFRVDRIIAVHDSGEVFQPRAEITIHKGDAVPFNFDQKPPPSEPPPTKAREAKQRAAPGTIAAVNRYFEFVESALLDGKADVSEKESAHVYASYLSLDQLRAVHAQVYMNVLKEILLDGQIDFKEEEYMRKVRKALKGLGWEP